MSKKHFIALADAIKAHNRLRGCTRFTQDQLDTLAHFCTCQNLKFNRARWEHYITGECGPNGGKVKVAA